MPSKERSARRPSYCKPDGDTRKMHVFLPAVSFPGDRRCRGAAASQNRGFWSPATGDQKRGHGEEIHESCFNKDVRVAYAPVIGLHPVLNHWATSVRLGSRQPIVENSLICYNPCHMDSERTTALFTPRVYNLRRGGGWLSLRRFLLP
jgi:hypothetical protein